MALTASAPLRPEHSNIENHHVDGAVCFQGPQRLVGRKGATGRKPALLEPLGQGFDESRFVVDQKKAEKSPFSVHVPFFPLPLSRRQFFFSEPGSGAQTVAKGRENRYPVVTVSPVKNAFLFRIERRNAAEGDTMAKTVKRNFL